MPSRPTAYRAATSVRLVSAFASVVVSTTLLGTVLAGFNWHSAGSAAPPVARVSCNQVG